MRVSAPLKKERRAMPFALFCFLFGYACVFCLGIYDTVTIYFTTILPTIPASLCPGMEQWKPYSPAVSNVREMVFSSPALVAITSSPLSSQTRLCSNALVFLSVILSSCPTAPVALFWYEFQLVGAFQHNRFGFGCGWGAKIAATTTSS